MVTRLSAITPSPTQRRMPLSPLYRSTKSLRSSPLRGGAQAERAAYFEKPVKSR